MNMNLHNLNWQRIEDEGDKSYREKVMELWQELLQSGEITQEQMNNSYYELYISKNQQ